MSTMLNRKNRHDLAKRNLLERKRKLKGAAPQTSKNPSADIKAKAPTETGAGK